LGDKPPDLALWHIPGYFLPAADAFHFLTALATTHLPPPLPTTRNERGTPPQMK
jgi:hypothetical protein